MIAPLAAQQPFLPRGPVASVIYGPLQQYAVVRFTGADALAFLHAQLTCDVRGLPPNRWTWAGYCTAKGRLLCTGILWRDGDSACLLLPSSQTEAVVKRLRQFVLRSKVTMSVEGNDRVIYGLRLEPGTPHALLGSLLPTQINESVIRADFTALRLARDWGLCWSSADAAGALHLMYGGEPATGHASDWDAISIQLGEPWLAPASQELYVPQMLNLERLGGVSFSKGCYPGQEIVARTQHLGQVKRRLFRFRAAITQVPAIGTRVVDQDKHPVGEVLRAANTDTADCVLLAVVATDAQERPLCLEDGPPLTTESLAHAAG